MIHLQPQNNIGPFVYRLGLKIFILARGVRLPYGLQFFCNFFLQKGPFVYRLGLKIFILARGVRLPYGLLKNTCWFDIGGFFLFYWFFFQNNLLFIFQKKLKALNLVEISINFVNLLIDKFRQQHEQRTAIRCNQNGLQFGYSFKINRRESKKQR